MFSQHIPMTDAIRNHILNIIRDINDKKDMHVYQLADFATMSVSFTKPSLTWHSKYLHNLLRQQSAVV